ncbi:MAG: hypothetical protein GEU98_00150 [Pseudonocardiaceae bacterium]|nr:hypothetical protein [Pseudonocardiaceae bacterium]
MSRVVYPGHQKLRDFTILHRLEFPFPITCLCAASWGASFAVERADDLLEAPILAAIGANLLLIVSGLALNVAVDLRTDELHKDKNYLAAAARHIGRSRIRRWIGTEWVVALGVATFLSLWSGRWLIVGAATAVIVLHVLYNIDPIRLKRRGFVGSIAFGTSVVALPYLLSYSAVRPDFSPPIWPILVGLTMLTIGRTIWWATPDGGADTESGITTPTVRYGAARTLSYSNVTMLLAVSLIGFGLWWRYGPIWTLLGIAAHSAFLGSTLRVFGSRSNWVAPSAKRMRTRNMPMAMIGDVVLAIIPLSAA